MARRLNLSCQGTKAAPVLFCLLRALRSIEHMVLSLNNKSKPLAALLRYNLHPVEYARKPALCTKFTAVWMGNVSTTWTGSCLPVCSQSPLPPHPGNHQSSFCTDWLFLDISCKLNHAIHRPLYLTSFTYCNAFEVQPRCNLYPQCLPSDTK